MGKGTRNRAQSARQRIAEQQAAARKAEQRRRVFLAGGAVVVVIAIVVVFVIIKAQLRRLGQQRGRGRGQRHAAAGQRVPRT